MSSPTTKAAISAIPKVPALSTIPTIPETVSRGAWRLLLLATLTTAVAAQQAEIDPMPADGSLPPKLLGVVPNNAWADTMILGDQDPARVRLRVSYSNLETNTSILLRWNASVSVPEGDFYDAKEETHTTSYQPTAVCVAAGKADEIYVAGWSKHTQTTVIERWTFVEASVAVAAGPNGAATMTFVAPTVRKELLKATTDVLPIEDMVFHPVSRQLILLEYGPSASVRGFAVDTPSSGFVPLFDASYHADWNEVSDLRFMLHEPTGYVLLGLEPSMLNPGPSPWQLVVLDADRDGVLEVETMARLEGDELNAYFPFADWVDDYSATP